MIKVQTKGYKMGNSILILSKCMVKFLRMKRVNDFYTLFNSSNFIVSLSYEINDSLN